MSQKRLALAELEILESEEAGKSLIDATLTPGQDRQSPSVNPDGIAIPGQHQPKQSRNRKHFVSKKNSVPPPVNTIGPSMHHSRHSPLAYQVHKSHSKGSNLRISPSSTHPDKMMVKSPSFDHAPRFGVSASRRSLKGGKNGIITMSHRANLDGSMARNSNRGIVTMSDRQGLKSGTVRIRSGRRRSSAMSNRSNNSTLGGTM